MNHIVFEIVPHLRSHGDWLLRLTRGAPFGMWFREGKHAESYAKWVAQELERAEV